MTDTITSGTPSAETGSSTRTTSSGDAGARPSSKTSPTADLKDLSNAQNPAVSGTDNAGNLPYPHQSLKNEDLNASIYKDEIAEVYREHEALKENPPVFVPSPEMQAARAEAQVTIAKELRARLAAQRTAASLETQEADKKNDTVRVKIFGNHTHGSTSYKAGDIFKVDQASADYIVLNRLGELA